MNFLWQIIFLISAGIILFSSFFIIHSSIKKKTKIAVSYATDNNYIYPIIVSMKSLVSNADYNTFYNIYILHTPDFTQYSKELLKTLEKKYYYKCHIIFCNMGNKYNGLQLSFKLATPAYYRLSLQDILLDVKRIIYLDGDTLVFQDLKDLIGLDMKESVIMGFLDSMPDSIESFGFKNATVICSGVLLMDLDGLRKNNYTKKIEDFIFKYKDNLTQHDQTIINVVMQDKISPIPAKYGIWEAWKYKSELKKYLKSYRFRMSYKEEELLNAIKYPAIVHFTRLKPFWKKHTAFYYDWWRYARSTGYYDIIYAKSPNPYKKNYL